MNQRVKNWKQSKQLTYRLTFLWQDSGFKNQGTHYIQLTAIILQPCLCVFSSLKRNWSGMKLKTICFYNCLGLSSSVILNFQYLGETALRFDVDIWKRGDFNPFFPLSHYIPRDPIERIWTFICFFYFYFFFYFYWGGGGWGKVRGTIYLIISKSTVFKHNWGFDCKKGKEKRGTNKPLINMRRSLVLVYKGNKLNFFPGAY